MQTLVEIGPSNASQSNDQSFRTLLCPSSVVFCQYIYIYIFFTHLIVFQSFSCFHRKKSLHSKRRELNKVILRAVSYIVLLRCRLIYSLHYAPYEHIYICMYIDSAPLRKDTGVFESLGRLIIVLLD